MHGGDAQQQDLERNTLRRVAWRLLPLLTLGYLVSFVDRSNVGFAALQMNRDVGLSQAAFGFGSGLFFLSYALLEVPSNLLMQRFGARRWLARIMISWGLLSAATALTRGPQSFYLLRLLLGAAEAGFFPGVVLYLTYWFPAAWRARIIALFMIAIPLSSLLGSPLSATLLGSEGVLGLHGWQWLFLAEALPAVLLGAFSLWWLQDGPAEARWLSDAERGWLRARLAHEAGDGGRPVQALPLARVLRHPRVLIAALMCAGSNAVSQSLSIWQPQIIKSFGISAAQTGWVNAIPFGLASALMIVWGRRSDRRGERLWHTAIPLTLVGAGLLGTLAVSALWPTVALLSVVLVSTYAFKGPFWALSTEWLAAPSAAGGIAFINAAGAAATFAGSWLLGVLRERTGSYPLGLLPMALLCLAGVATLLWTQRRDLPAARGALS